MTKLSAVLIIALGLVFQSADAPSTTAEPYELTSRGTIPFDANRRYKSADVVRVGGARFTPDDTVTIDGTMRHLIMSRNQS